MASSISDHRQRQILALTLDALAVLLAASLASFRLPEPGMAPWTAPNWCGPPTA